MRGIKKLRLEASGHGSARIQKRPGAYQPSNRCQDGLHAQCSGSFCGCACHTKEPRVMGIDELRTQANETIECRDNHGQYCNCGGINPEAVLKLLAVVEAAKANELLSAGPAERRALKEALAALEKL